MWLMLDESHRRRDDLRTVNLWCNSNYQYETSERYWRCFFRPGWGRFWYRGRTWKAPFHHPLDFLTLHPLSGNAAAPTVFAIAGKEAMGGCELSSYAYAFNLVWRSAGSANLLATATSTGGISQLCRSVDSSCTNERESRCVNFDSKQTIIPDILPIPEISFPVDSPILSTAYVISELVPTKSLLSSFRTTPGGNERLSLTFLCLVRLYEFGLCPHYYFRL